MMHAYLMSTASGNKHSIAKALIDSPYWKLVLNDESLYRFVRQKDLLIVNRISNACINAAVPEKFAKGRQGRIWDDVPYRGAVGGGS